MFDTQYTSSFSPEWKRSKDILTKQKTVGRHSLFNIQHSTVNSDMSSLRKKPNCTVARAKKSHAAKLAKMHLTDQEQRWLTSKDGICLFSILVLVAVKIVKRFILVHIDVYLSMLNECEKEDLKREKATRLQRRRRQAQRFPKDPTYESYMKERELGAIKRSKFPTAVRMMANPTVWLNQP